MKDLLSNYL